MTDRSKEIDSPHCKPPRQINEDLDREWCRGYFSAVAAYLRMNCAKGTFTTEAESLFRVGGDCSKAHQVDIQTFRDHGLIAPPSHETKN